MSYAWKDNSLPPGDNQGKSGFVTALAGQIDYWFDYLFSANTQQVSPQLWWDRDIDAAQQFNPAIERAINESSFFLIVLSEHWLASEYCRKELALFRQRWQHEDDFAFKHRLILVHKEAVPREKFPDIFPEQRGLQFYSGENQFFRKGRGTTEFIDTAEELGTILARRARHITNERKEPPPEKAPTGPKVYLAKPAPDMREHYVRVYKELVGENCQVVPGLTEEIPLDSSATSFIENALAGARLSIHLIGKSAGPAPADLEHIVKLQLSTTGAKLAPDPSSGFHRLVWTPRSFADPSGQQTERDPVDAATAFGADASKDRIVGDTESPFIQFVREHIKRLDQPPPQPQPRDGKVYLCHDEADTKYALQVASLLRANNIDYSMPVYFKTSELDRRQFHRRRLAECSAVLMCWANASEMWAVTQADELRDWEALGRKGRFSYRGLIAGPPPDERKDDEVLRHLFSPNEVDIVLNWTATEHPSTAELQAILAQEQRAP